MASELGCLVELTEDEDDLFEIDLDAFDSIPPPQYHWETSVVTATGSALLANCLLPISDLCSAVPIASREHTALSFARPSNVVMIGEPMPLGKLIIQLSSLGSFEVQSKDMKA